MILGLYEVSRKGRQCVVASPTMLHAREDATLQLGGKPELARRIGTAVEGMPRGVVVAASDPPRRLAPGPAVLAAAMRAAGFAPEATRSRQTFVARAAAWVILRDLGNMSTVKIGALTGHDHSTVISALAQLERLATIEQFRAARVAAAAAYKDATT